MKVELFGIGAEVYFINDEQKVTWGYITGISYEARREGNSDRFSAPVRETTIYIIDNKFRRNGKFVFRTKGELLNSL